MIEGNSNTISHLSTYRNNKRAQYRQEADYYQVSDPVNVYKICVEKVLDLIAFNTQVHFLNFFPFAVNISRNYLGIK